MAKSWKLKNGAPGNAKGRPKGTPNKFTTLKHSFLNVYQRMGGDDALLEWAKSHKALFYQMITKLFPQEHEHSGELAHTLKFKFGSNGEGTTNGD